ncbi:neural cell adhesion molecule 1-like isoform X2 [Physella acuta]|uniref:neural cell adhesion molecule 1-like isoform X2 n=1 Tax=Physella acuta TaxID=109671 RepID=UPI0027DD4E6F|nr:neural cell adhesion molecule 1-like isoform X2 [Physella acuta]
MFSTNNMDFAYILLVAAFFTTCAGQKTISFSMKITPEGDTIDGNVGSGKVLTCSAVSQSDSGQKPEIKWFINGVELTATTGRVRIELGSDSSSKRLRINSVEDGDEGEYKCEVTFGSETDSRKTNLQVYKLITIKSPENQWGLFGQEGNVMCEAEAKPSPTITWKFEDGSRVTTDNNKYVIGQSKLTIKDLSFEDSKNYVCDVVVDQSGEAKVFTINYVVVKPPTIDLPPTIQPNNPKVGDRVTISCVAQGSPQPTYEYKRGENLIAENKEGILLDKNSGILTIEKLQREDEALYTCIASNQGGKVEKSNTLDVKIPPVIKQMTNITDAAEGGNINFKCEAEGDPEPSIVWKKLGSESTYSDTGVKEEGLTIETFVPADLSDAIIKRAGKTISFNPVRYSHVGIYVCSAVNTVGNATQAVSLEVLYKPNFDTDFKDKEFWGWAGHRANLTCVARANEKAGIQWIIKDEADPTKLPVRIENGGPYTISENRQLGKDLTAGYLEILLDSTSSQMYRNYICEAKNSFGEATQEITLKEATTPEQPKVSLESAYTTMVTLNVEPPTRTGGQPVTEYSYTVDNTALTGKATLTGQVTRLEVDGLEPSKSYIIRVKARNNVGLGTDYPFNVETLKVSKPLRLDITSPANGADATQYVLMWADPANSGSPITSFRVVYRMVEVEANDDPTKWKVKADKDTTSTVRTINGGGARSYTISGLQKDSYYEIRLTAFNDIGESDVEIKIIRTGKGGEVIEESEKSTDGNVSKILEVDKSEERKNETNDEVLSSSSESADETGSAGVGSGAIVGIIVGILIFVLLIVVIVVFIWKKKPELLHRLSQNIGTGREEERGKGEDGKDPAEEEKLIKNDTVKVENETEEGKNEAVEEHPEEFEPDSKPEQPTTPEAPKSVEKTEELTTPAATTEIKITPETPEKPPENPTA